MRAGLKLQTRMKIATFHTIEVPCDTRKHSYNDNKTFPVIKKHLRIRGRVSKMSNEWTVRGNANEISGNVYKHVPSVSKCKIKLLLCRC